MTTFGYARVSTDDQSLDVQRAALKAAGCEMIREEKVSGASREGRDELAVLLDFIRAGDTLIVTKLDRLSRNTVDMLTIIQELGERDVGVKSLAEPWADTTTPAGKLMLTVFAGVAEFERARSKERQREGIEAAKAKGVYTGGKQTVDRLRVWQMLDDKVSKAEIARQLDCSEMTIHRIVKEGRPGVLVAVQ
jgi:DNA invertase Pin-like site-specific DNA recombinase